MQYRQRWQRWQRWQRRQQFDLERGEVRSGIGRYALCVEYEQPNPMAAANQASTCKSNGGTVVNQCSTTGLVGTCAYTNSGIPEVVHTYAGDAGATTASAKKVCDSEQGTFTPP